MPISKKKEEKRDQESEEREATNTTFEEEERPTPTIEARTDEKKHQLTPDQVEQLEKFGIIGGKVLAPVDVAELKYVWNSSLENLILLDLKFVIRPHQLVNLKKFFTDDELQRSKSLQVAMNSMDEELKSVRLEDMKPEDVKEVKSELDILEEQHELIPEGGTKLKLKIDRHNNPFFARLWLEEEKIIKMNKAKGIMDQNPDEVILHGMEGAI